MKRTAKAASDNEGEQEPGDVRPGGGSFDLEELLASVRPEDDLLSELMSPSELEALLDSVRSEDDPLSGLSDDTLLRDLEAAIAAFRSEDPLHRALDEGALIAELDTLLASSQLEEGPAGSDERRLIEELNATLDGLLEGEGSPRAGSGYHLVVRRPDLPPPDPNLTAAHAAAWMRDEVEREGYLHQGVAAYHVRDHFGERFTYSNENGNLAISRDVLRAFLRLTHRTVVWEWREFRWRLRQPGDPPTRRVD